MLDQFHDFFSHPDCKFRCIVRVKLHIVVLFAQILPEGVGWHFGSLQCVTNYWKVLLFSVSLEVLAIYMSTVAALLLFVTILGLLEPTITDMLKSEKSEKCTS